jgi:segregation and condensation protein B
MSVKAKIEAVIYAADEPVTLAQLSAIFADEVLAAGDLPFEDVAENSGPAAASVEENAQPETAEQPALPMEDAEAKKRARIREREARLAIEKIVAELIAEYANGDRGMEIREIAGGYRVATKAEYHDAVRSFVKSLKPQMKLSLQALETLAVVAYKQPITAPEISEIRGVDTAGVLGGLMARKLITTAGRKQVIGRPILYKTTKEFLLRFGLKDVSELPSMEEFEKMAADMAESDESSITGIVSEDHHPAVTVAEEGETSSESDQ